MHPSRGFPGGSVVCRHEAISHLKTLGPVVYLDVPLPELLRRIQNLSTRGIAMKPSQSLKDVMALREPLYHQYADIVLPCHASQSLEDTVEAVLIALKRKGINMYVEYIVKDIRGDYAILVDNQGNENPVALALLPAAIDLGQTIAWENFEYRIL
ncbi:shikimate kinase [Bengtsoniella intestinalis]|uniref:shikimate kinase n=1 Tax=Bengtsoniella intestinalis TaxID=3073143 RepID=UPI00391F9EBC